MTTITKERLLTIKQWRETYGPGSNVVLPAEEAEELARIALASLEAKPIGAFHIAEQQVDGTSDYLKDGEWPIDNGIIEVYAVPPVPVIQADVAQAIENLKQKLVECNRYNYCADAVKGVEDACHAVMLQSQDNGIKDGWISCSERMPKKNQNVLISVNFDSDLVEPLICSARYTGSTFRRGEATIKPGNGVEQVTHWMPLPEPPQEVNRGQPATCRQR
ncbi:DUF551 domain-containing protein [Escherichia sp. 11.1597]|uniref:DUF551 domain-containing protein n=1 Tax=unclassified Escherichia TaxID=2608889 RepID=UPI000CF75B17|nr:MULTISPECIES: DUF551 domain-containing protein [unclassified Escherichia]MBB2425809.1 DUF551 domain-containing protein [Escherichia sp. 11.1597]